MLMKSKGTSKQQAFSSGGRPFEKLYFESGKRRVGNSKDAPGADKRYGMAVDYLQDLYCRVPVNIRKKKFSNSMVGIIVCFPIH